jgi:glycyl-tRNA synthetase
MKKEGMPEMAKEIAKELRAAGIETFYDESGSVGRRYRRQDEIGTPWCITVDFDSITEKTVTLRERDSMKQERVKISEITKLISDKIKY